jgi:hypothetical protein
MKTLEELGTHKICDLNKLFLHLNNIPQFQCFEQEIKVLHLPVSTWLCDKQVDFWRFYTLKKIITGNEVS